MDYTRLRTLGQLKAAQYRTRSVKTELRENLIAALREGRPLFKGIYDYDETVLPQLRTAILARHDILLLGLRGQAKTRLARLMVELLDPYIPAIEGTELPEDPFQPITAEGQLIVTEAGDDTPIRWIAREERYIEKLATPDVSVADLIGDIDPIKAATLKLPYSDPRIIHYGLIPRAHRGLFVINELPDLQPRIQVALFNILQEKDIQIRGYSFRLPLDIQFLFTANPEDYTQRGTIITPLKDRIGSQILTHYPRSIESSRRITQQEARIHPDTKARVIMPDVVANTIERIGFIARQSEYIDQKSGVSARLTITAYECVMATAEQRCLLQGESHTTVRLIDIYGALPAIIGKIELVYEGEKEGIQTVGFHLFHKAMREEFLAHFPSPEKFRRSSQPNPYKPIIDYFNAGNTLSLSRWASDADYQQQLRKIPALLQLVESMRLPGSPYTWMELVLHGLADLSLLGRAVSEQEITLKDILGDMLKRTSDDDDEDEEED